MKLLLSASQRQFVFRNLKRYISFYKSKKLNENAKKLEKMADKFQANNLITDLKRNEVDALLELLANSINAIKGVTIPTYEKRMAEPKEDDKTDYKPYIEQARKQLDDLEKLQKLVKMKLKN